MMGPNILFGVFLIEVLLCSSSANLQVSCLHITEIAQSRIRHTSLLLAACFQNHKESFAVRRIKYALARKRSLCILFVLLWFSKLNTDTEQK